MLPNVVDGGVEGVGPGEVEAQGLTCEAVKSFSPVWWMPCTSSIRSRMGGRLCLGVQVCVDACESIVVVCLMRLIMNIL